ncbi:hypothetical protein AB4Y45_34675 [Paraburkholderia sp. EG287A]|uniref:hypothetical protein n=1 Tax=Paraburkholderia sp. EG287A TaxID=3237012 RepID=UPI0034D28D5F
MSSPIQELASAQQFVPQATVAAAVDLFEQLRQYAHTPEQLARADRQLADVRTLMEAAARQASGTLIGLHELRKLVQREGESDIDGFSALLELLPYLTGAHGVYIIEFHYEGRVQKNVRKTLEGWEVRDEGGEPISLDEVFIMLRRRDVAAEQSKGAPAGALA